MTDSSNLVGSNSPPSPRVLVGITTRNRASILPKALASARAQNYPNLTIAVLDDGSTDGTSALSAQYPDITWQTHAQSRGIIESRNELMRGCDAEYYVSIDDDAWFLQRDEISRAIARLERAPHVAAIAFDILSPDRPTPVSRNEPEMVSIFIGCGHVLRLAAVRAAGFYASAPGIYGSEEKDLCYRLADLGYSVEKLTGVHVWHEKAWNDRDWYGLHRSGVCNEFAMTLRRCPAPDVLAVMPLKLLSFCWFWVRQPRFLAPGLAGVAQFLAHFAGTCASRQPVKREIFWSMVRRRAASNR
ncbi:MAG TPA: glycosyltransferase family 2 protein [Opitutaceae bacterium]|nr:glycosyltransferase family 2 protein [Opitutaceae bacterium]